MNLVWLKLIKRILTHKYYVAKFSFTEFSRAIKYWDDKMSSLANECRILGYSQTFLHHRGRNPHYHTAMKEGKYYCDFNPFMDDDENHYVEVSEGQYYGAC